MPVKKTRVKKGGDNVYVPEYYTTITNNGDMAIFPEDEKILLIIIYTHRIYNEGLDRLNVTYANYKPQFIYIYNIVTDVFIRNVTIRNSNRLRIDYEDIIKRIILEFMDNSVKDFKLLNNLQSYYEKMTGFMIRGTYTTPPH